MRKGMNPLRDKTVPGMPKVVMCMITHLPDQEGYHAERLEIIKLALNSMREHAGQDAAVMVWDNGSACTEFLNWLVCDFMPEIFVMSDNVGRNNARTAMINMFPDDTIIAMSDDDMFFYPGWLSESIDILENFPNVGMVSAYPVRVQFHRAPTSSTLDWAKKNAKREDGKFIPEQWNEDFWVSIGIDSPFYKNRASTIIEKRAVYKGRSVYLTSHHCQWAGYAGRIKPLLWYDKEAMAPDKPFDTSINDAGLLRLTTTERLSRHIGNVLDDDIREEAEGFGLI